MSFKSKLKYIFPVFICFVFLQSLFFKFSDSAETRHIFGTLNEWALSLGLPALFIPPLIPGVFNAYVIGTAELISSLIIIYGIFKDNLFVVLGSILSLGIISGAICFHLFTPLGIEVQGDGGTLFIMACGVFVCSVANLIIFSKAKK